MEWLKKIESVVLTEREAISELVKILGPEHEAVAEAILNCKGKLVFLGVGKSAHIGKKLAATFALYRHDLFFMQPPSPAPAPCPPSSMARKPVTAIWV